MTDQKWIVCETQELSDTVKQYGLISLEVELAKQFHRMLKTGIIKRKTKMVVVGRSDMTLPETVTLLGKDVPVMRDDRIKVTEDDGVKQSTVYLMRRKDYKRMANHVD
jgi:hypothetical protein